MGGEEGGGGGKNGEGWVCIQNALQTGLSMQALIFLPTVHVPPGPTCTLASIHLCLCHVL